MTDPFQPSWLRAALVLVIATASFFIPQGVPLEYYPLNNPSSGLQYLEVTCASNVDGETRFYLNFGHGYNELDKIQLPIGPSEMAFTYTFPLLDGPLIGLRVDPFMSGAGELTITNFRIINRREEEICRFDKDSFKEPLEIDKIVPLEKGWKIVTKADSKDPNIQVKLSHALIPEGMNERNLKRCLLSTGYLTMMLWIILLAVYFALRLFPSWRAAGRACLFLLFMAAAFSIVGNRGLIRNSWFYAKKAHRLEMQIKNLHP
jgi:hypothetical protein